MQTFLPYQDFEKSVKCLDNKRLGKQRVEAFQILKALDLKNQGIKAAWQNHPATLMWENNIEALKLYMNTCIQEWCSRGFRNTMSIVEVDSYITYPSWFGNETLHSSHRSNLLRKDFNYYGQFNWLESNNLEYYWPTKQSKSN